GRERTKDTVGPVGDRGAVPGEAEPALPEKVVLGGRRERAAEVVQPARELVRSGRPHGRVGGGVQDYPSRVMAGEGGHELARLGGLAPGGEDAVHDRPVGVGDVVERLQAPSRDLDQEQRRDQRRRENLCGETHVFRTYSAFTARGKPPARPRVSKS